MRHRRRRFRGRKRRRVRAYVHVQLAAQVAGDDDEAVTLSAAAQEVAAAYEAADQRIRVQLQGNIKETKRMTQEHQLAIKVAAPQSEGRALRLDNDAETQHIRAPAARVKETEDDLPAALVRFGLNRRN